MWRAWLVGFVAFFALAALLARPLSAQEDTPKQEAPAAEHTEKSGHAEGGIPGGVKGLFSWTLDLALWTIVVFLLLLFVLGRFAWKPMLEGLQKREDNIRSALDEAQRARDEAQRVREQLQAEMNQAAQKVRDMMDAARRDAERSTSEMVTKTRAEIQTERERLRREIDLAKDQALQQIWSQTAQLATLVSAKAIRRQLNEEDHRRLVDEAIAELRPTGNGNAR
jgi:F-type H+-transporting ATPase subunit b